MMPLVFVVDAVSERRGLVRNKLELAGYHVEGFATTRVLDRAEQQLPAAIILAIDLPDGSGLELRQRIRNISALAHTPILLLVEDATHPDFGKGESEDHWLTSATVCDEVLMALRDAIRKRAFLGSTISPLEADIVIDPSAMKISVLGKEVTTTTLEFRLLEYMARHHGKVFTRDALLDAVWGDLQFVTPRSVDACVRRIRHKIEPNSYSPTFLRTIRGVGYKLDARTEWKTESQECHCKTCTAARSRATSNPSIRGFGVKAMGRSASFS